MTLKEALTRSREVLLAGGVDWASLESEVLLRHVLGLGRVELYLEHDCELAPEPAARFWRLVGRRRRGEPTAYITGHREFYGRDFGVDRRVLIPRPESELLVEKALDLARRHRLSTIAEIGTGCGAIAISLACELPGAVVYATDISVPALEVASVNLKKHGVGDRVRLLPGDMLDPLPEACDIVIANLPYVDNGELSRLAEYEPRLALDGGPAGLEKIFRFCRRVGDKLKVGGHVLLEIGQGQGEAVIGLLSTLYPLAAVALTPDLAGIERVVSLSLAAPCGCPAS
ncbi:MAG: peptide chain release factor N(5)-glutamine methyltransferase [Chloroflexota bacterium]